MPEVVGGRKLLRRFYEPLLLLDGLGQIRGERTPPEPPSDGHSTETLQAARNFADALAYFCAFVKGPDHVTAIVLERVQAKVKVWVAANRSVKPAISPFLEKLLSKVKDVATFTSEERIKETTDSAIDQIITFNVARLNDYHKMIKPLVMQFRNAHAGRPSDYLAASQRRQINTLMAWLEHNFEDREHIPADGWCGFARECHKRRDTFRVLNEIRLPQSQVQVTERLCKLLWKLGKHITLSRRFFDATRQLSWEFSNGFVVDLVSSPPGQKTPLKSNEATVSCTIHRMFSNDKEKEQFQETLQSIHNAGRLDYEINRTRDTQCRVHAELILLNHLHQKGCNFLDPEDKYIGVSKPACYLCHAYIKEHPGRFVVPRSHQKSWIGWRPPGVDLETNHMTKDGRQILLKLIDIVRDKLKDEVNHRCHEQTFREDSTTGASTVKGGPQGPIYAWQKGVSDDALAAHNGAFSPSVPSSQKAKTVSEGYHSTDDDGGSINTDKGNKENKLPPRTMKSQMRKDASGIVERAREMNIIDEDERAAESNAEDEDGGVPLAL